MESREFRHSKGLTKLLRYICAKALVGDPEPITEYTIAMDVLGKSAGFKENKDASVRVEVHRLRKRLAEFYQNDESPHRVRIVIPIGNYTPEFAIQDDIEEEPDIDDREIVPAPVEVAVSAPPEPAPLPASIPPGRVASARWGYAWTAPASLVLAMALMLAVGAVARPPDPLESLWRPMLSSPNRVLLCVGDMAAGHATPADPTPEAMTVLDFHGLKSQSVLIDDAATMSRFAGLLESKGKAFRVVSQSEATIGDLQNGPAVLIGLANNDWTERLVGKLRFWLQHSGPGGKLIIRDRENPARSDWNIDYSEPLLQVTRDYALVMRVLDPKTEQTVISAAGITAFGTLAAGDFLTQAEEVRKIEAVAPKDWRKMNFELVLSTDVIRGKAGHTNIVGSYFW